MRTTTHRAIRDLPRRIALCCAMLLTSVTSTALAQAVDSSAADARSVAQRIAAAHGNPYAASEIRFTFVVEVGGEERARRSFVWHPIADSVRVTSGEETIEIVETASLPLSESVHEPDAHADVWAQAAPGTPPEAAARAWAQFINDSFWLVAPSKVIDPLAELSIDGEGRLVVSYPTGGVTPGDQYRYEYDAETGRILSWHYVLAAGREGTFRWSDYERHAPLWLSLTRTSDESNATIRFEDVSVR